jgi:hypothetical protein
VGGGGDAVQQGELEGLSGQGVWVQVVVGVRDTVPQGEQGNVVSISCSNWLAVFKCHGGTWVEDVCLGVGCGGVEGGDAVAVQQGEQEGVVSISYNNRVLRVIICV